MTEKRVLEEHVLEERVFEECVLEEHVLEEHVLEERVLEERMTEECVTDIPKRYGRGIYPRVVKRLLDIITGIIALPFVAVSFLIIAILIKREDKGPLFYNAPRIGRDGQVFTMYKYRTMCVDAPDIKESDGSTYNAPDDPRLTKVGVMLRRTSLDEFPQVINVLKGDMSFVGPRPDLADEVALYSGEESLRLSVRPGISGYAQVYGRNAIPWRERLALDVVYIKRQSLILDARIFFKTFAVVLLQKGIFIEDESHADRQEK